MIQLSRSLLFYGFKLLAFTAVMYLLTGFSRLDAQVLNDTASLNLVKETVDEMYNMRFSEATITCNKISKIYPEHPVVFLLRGMITYWQNYPLMPGTAQSRDFEDQMHRCMAGCEDPKPGNEAEFLLANLCARGGLLAFYTDGDLLSKAFPLARSSYKYLRRSFKFTRAFPDFYFFTGLYNYYREAYPEIHPLYKPLFAVFPRGDKANGLKELRTSFEKSIFMRAEAATFLSSNYKYFENDFASASSFSTSIFNKYPANLVFRLNCIEDLLLTGYYDKAESLINSPDLKVNNKYYEAQLSIFRGILEEKKYYNMNMAGREYSAGIKNIAEYGNYGEQFAAYAWFGLSRICAAKNDSHNQRICRNKALDLTDFGNVNFDE